ncbi:MAG TPA: hypothetical protein VN887_17235 [Candidatus Angelobacter sp.]|nr:hypothetical protein [Candidatus Angelobacter sp.]
MAALLRANGEGRGAGIVFARSSFEKDEQRIQTMTKTLEVLSDVIRNNKHPFRQVDDRPDKSKKHRYERRKIKECLKLGDWDSETQGSTS